MMTARRRDQLDAPRGSCWIETDVRLDAGMVIGRTRIWIERRSPKVVGAVRVLAVDAAGEVLGFTGERSFRVGGRGLFRSGDRTIEWSSALFADSLDGVIGLDVLHFVPRVRRRIRRP